MPPRHCVEYTHVPTAVVCIPTYNERENLEAMLRALGDKQVRVLVIDDNSPDGTGELADLLARAAKVRLLLPHARPVALLEMISKAIRPGLLQSQQLPTESMTSRDGGKVIQRVRLHSGSGRGDPRS